MAKRAPKLLRLSVAAHELGLHPITVRRWIKAGRIQVVQMGREVRVPRAEIERMVGKLDGRLVVLYGRVSGHGQKGDLETQQGRLQAWARTERNGQEILVLSDIGSGLKAGRRHLQRLLTLACEDKVAEVVITSEDRLTRFGSHYIETLLEAQGRHLEMIFQSDTGDELVDDCVSVITSMAARISGRRQSKRRAEKIKQCVLQVMKEEE